MRPCSSCCLWELDCLDGAIALPHSRCSRPHRNHSRPHYLPLRLCRLPCIHGMKLPPRCRRRLSRSCHPGAPAQPCKTRHHPSWEFGHDANKTGKGQRFPRIGTRADEVPGWLFLMEGPLKVSRFQGKTRHQQLSPFASGRRLNQRSSPPPGASRPAGHPQPSRRLGRACQHRSLRPGRLPPSTRLSRQPRQQACIWKKLARPRSR